MKLTVVAIIIILTVVATLKFVGYKSSSKTDPRETAVKIESIAPAFGSVGTEITITGTGFATDQNDIGFNWKTAQAGYNTGYINLNKSADGKTLQFKLPEAASVCAVSTAPPDSACIQLALIIPKEKIEIFVLNKNGRSNSVGFVVN